MRKFSVQKNPSKPFSASVTELKKYIGICLLMDIAPLPHTRMYWETEFPNEPDLGASANIVIRLARSIPRDKNYKLFFDNYYPYPELITYLANEGIYSMGTVNKARLGKSIQIPSMKDLKSSKKERGYSEECVCNVNGTDIVAVMWYDNKPVVLTSSFIGKDPTQKVRRFCKKQKKYILVDIDCPQIVRNYN
ncbi:unnamed protein product [Parnassius apollo]|uniref:(apollo) hypothetical protein n=1 Tax=Parnassius apollo TaxID=110799 RepID=A0A8S3XF63_PARAO|nr:unnamed protein product [Parnassius apollo]